VDRLKTLKEMHAALKHEPVVELGPVSHGDALSVYFRDPEGNRVELLIDTPWYVPQPHRAPLDLSRSEDEIWSRVESQARSNPGFKPRAQWQADITQKLAR
jgi:hypothetical protein